VNEAQKYLISFVCIVCCVGFIFTGFLLIIFSPEKHELLYPEAVAITNIGYADSHLNFRVNFVNLTMYNGSMTINCLKYVGGDLNFTTCEVFEGDSISFSVDISKSVRSGDKKGFFLYMNEKKLVDFLVEIP
jgi:hypothetical protein